MTLTVGEMKNLLAGLDDNLPLRSQGCSITGCCHSITGLVSNYDSAKKKTLEIWVTIRKDNELDKKGVL
jgi:hypothetical protein